jgi:hypothetical protein
LGLTDYWNILNQHIVSQQVRVVILSCQQVWKCHAAKKSYRNSADKGSDVCVANWQ